MTTEAVLDTCVPCAYAAEHGWWGDTLPPNGTHYSKCHATWTGMQAAHTTCCHFTFGGNAVADKFHDKLRSDLGKCPTEHELNLAGLNAVDDHRGRIMRTDYKGPSGRPNAETGTEPSFVAADTVGRSQT